MIIQKVIKAIGHLVNGDVTLCERCVFDYLTIQWDNVNLSQCDLDLWLSPSPPSVFDIKILFEENYLEIPMSYSKLLFIILKVIKLNY